DPGLMEKRDRKPGYFARLKRRRQLKQSQSDKTVSEQSPTIISCPDVQNDPNKKADLERTTAKLPAGSDDGCKTNNQEKREKRRPPGTVEFIVGPNDSLNSIALKFNITPNKLVQLNKLFSRSVYPGQRLFVPDVNQSEADSKSPSSSDPPVTNGLSESASHDGVSSCMSAKSIRRELSPNSEDESPATVKFIKMSCKYFTDGMGVVGGVLIVTPNNIMFDPHKSDPLVIEHGCEEYGLICPMEEVVSVALYDDVSRMKLKDALPSPGEWEQLPSERDLNPFSRYEALDPKRPIVLDDIESTLSETGSTEGEQTEMSPSDEGFTELEPTVNGSTEEAEGTSSKTPNIISRDQQKVGPSSLGGGDLQVKSMLSQTKGKLDDEEDEGVAQNSSIEDGESIQSSSETEKQGDSHEKPASQEVTETKDMKPKGTQELLNDTHDKIIAAPVDQNRKLSLEEASEVNGNSSPKRQSPDGPAGGAELSEEERRRKNYEAEVKTWLLERMQAPIEDMLFSSEEKSKNPPMFLCFKVGKPMRKSFTYGITSSPAHLFGGSGKQPEYWFAVPQERVDHLYAFFVQWSPDVYGKDAREQGFVVVEKDELDMIDNFFSDPASCSWEIITIDEAKRRQSFGSCDGDLSVDALPVLSDTSDLLQDTHIEKLACRLPARVQGYPWRLAYSTEKHGTSLKTLYRNLADVDSPVLLVIKDMDNQIFGAFSTHPFRVSEHCYGTGETFLYSFCPEIKVYRWTGENSYFVKGNTDSLQMGGGGGQLGLWLDAELYRGTTTKCATFNNQPLSAQQDFNIHSLEVWTFDGLIVSCYFIVILIQRQGRRVQEEDICVHVTGNMEINNSDSSEETSDTCIFCLIASGQDKDTEVIKKVKICVFPFFHLHPKQNKELVCFRDIDPAAPHHYLVVPVQHIHSCFSLHRGHIGLVKRMAEMGKTVLHDQGITDVTEMRLGFHQPPYTSVDHLHLHVLAPTSQISKYLEYKFIPGSQRFIIGDSCSETRPDFVQTVSEGVTVHSVLMGTQDASETEDCPFCQIANNQTDTEVLLSDEELLCFRDVKPGAAHHYLVVPRTHIDNCKSLQREDVALVERMVEMGRSVLEKNKVSDLDDVRMGFHLPPFSSVPHLHLHALAP
ncbi:hypothetical protein L3Q82_011114, partial [Scortum barcoo]